MPNRNDIRSLRGHKTSAIRLDSTISMSLSSLSFLLLCVGMEGMKFEFLCVAKTFPTSLIDIGIESSCRLWECRHLGHHHPHPDMVVDKGCRKITLMKHYVNHPARPNWQGTQFRLWTPGFGLSISGEGFDPVVVVGWLASCGFGFRCSSNWCREAGALRRTVPTRSAPDSIPPKAQLA